MHMYTSFILFVLAKTDQEIRLLVKKSRSSEIFKLMYVCVCKAVSVSMRGGREGKDRERHIFYFNKLIEIKA